MARSKKKAEGAPASVRATPGLYLILVITAAAACLLALYQWMELLRVLEGGTPFCAIGESFDCAGVWAASSAKAIQNATSMPVAGWGLVWALGAFGIAMRAVSAALSGKSPDAAIFGARLFAAAGVAASLLLFLVTVQLGVFCITCLSTYALVVVYAVVAFRMRPSRTLADVGVAPVAAPVSVLLVISYLALLIPGSRTPLEGKIDLHLGETAPVKTQPVPPPSSEPDRRVARPEPQRPDSPPPSDPPPPAQPAPDQGDDEVAAYLRRLPPPAKQAVADGLDGMRRSKRADRSKFGVRLLHGPKDAKIKIVDFVDIRCGHCRMLDEVLSELERVLPPGTFSVEPRHYPLDAQCNPEIPEQMKDSENVRCTAAKALICLEGDPDAYFRVRTELFKEQQTLTAARLWQIVGGAKKPDVIKTCVASAATDQKLFEDIRFASMYDVHGTPVVLINGLQGSGVGPFLYAIMIAGGDPNHPAFSQGLPPPSPPHAH